MQQKARKQMQVEISDEQIDKMVTNAIKTRIDAWFNDSKNKYIIRDTVVETISEKLGTREVSKVINEEVINSAKRLCTKDIVRQVCDRVSNDIAGAFAEKYGDY